MLTLFLFRIEREAEDDFDPAAEAKRTHFVDLTPRIEFVTPAAERAGSTP